MCYLCLVPSPKTLLTSTPILPVLIGANVNLTCDVQLDPSVDIPVTVVTTWFGPGGILQNGSDTMKGTAEYLSTLMLTSLVTEKAGDYTCSVTVTPSNSSYVIPLTQNTTTQGKNSYLLSNDIIMVPLTSLHSRGHHYITKHTTGGRTELHLVL